MARRRFHPTRQRRRHVPIREPVCGGLRPYRRGGGRLHRQRAPRPRRHRHVETVTDAGVCWATATEHSSLRKSTRSVTDHIHSWRATSPGTASSIWPSRTPEPTRCRSFSATAMERFSPREPSRRSGSELGGSISLVAGDFNGDGKLDLAVVEPPHGTDVQRCRCFWATATARSSPRCRTGGRGAILHRGRRLQWRRESRPGNRQCNFQ